MPTVLSPLHRRALALALGLLLLVTQQVGLLHLLSHALAAPAAAGVVAQDHAAPADAADGLCQTCLALAALGLAALPAAWRWRSPRAWPGRPASRPAAPLVRLAAAPYQARAPPSSPALT